MASLAAVTLFFPVTSIAQGVSVGLAPHVGTLGIGADIALKVSPMVSVRAGANFFPFDIDLTESGINYTIDLPSPQFTAMVDVYPGGSIFRISGGVLQSSQDIEATGELGGTVDIGGVTYTGSEVGTLSGAIVTRDLSPYIGIGLGNPAGSRVGFFLDLGVAFHGTPEVELNATGPIASNAQFQMDLAREEADFEDGVSNVTVYPVASVGFSIRLY